MRLAALVFALMPAMAMAGEGVIRAAEFTEPTERYQHGVFGDTSEWGALRITLGSPLRVVNLRLPETHVFEDIAPRLADLTGDGQPEVIVVETDMAQGARLSVYNDDGLVAATPYIGRTHRWLAPAGFADFNGDGRLDVAYVETPHLGRVLRVFTLESDPAPHLVEIGQLAGITNHRLGDPLIRGGVRVCADGPQIVGASPDWSRILVARFVDGRLQAADSGPLGNPAELDAALACN